MKPRRTRKQRGTVAAQPARASSAPQSTVDLPKFEIKEVLNAPLVFELEVAAQLMIKLIKKLPPEAQPAGVAAALAEINVLEGAAEGIVSQFPRVPHEYSNRAIQHQTELMQQYLLTHLES